MGISIMIATLLVYFNIHAIYYLYLDKGICWVNDNNSLT